MDLLRPVRRLAGDEREALARLVAHLAEVEARRLYEPAGYASLFVYCHEGLGYSEDAAYNRKTAAQVAVRYPVVIEMLGDGRLSLTAVRLLAPVLTDDNWEATFAEATGLPKSEVEKIVARLKPRPDVPSTVRKLPVPGPGEEPAAPDVVPERQTQALLAQEETQPQPEGRAPAAANGRASRPIVAPLPMATRP